MTVQGRKRVLFPCTGNSCRSQIAAYLQTSQGLRALLLLAQVNQEISQSLVVDFAGLARKSECLGCSSA